MIVGFAVALSALQAQNSITVSDVTVQEGQSAVISVELNNETVFSAFQMDLKLPAGFEVATTANDTYLKTSGDTSGVASYGAVTDMLVSWHYQEVIIPSITEPEVDFDPMDETQVDLTGLPHAPVSTEPTEEAA